MNLNSLITLKFPHDIILDIHAHLRYYNIAQNIPSIFKKSSVNSSQTSTTRNRHKEHKTQKKKLFFFKCMFNYKNNGIGFVCLLTLFNEL